MNVIVAATDWLMFISLGLSLIVNFQKYSYWSEAVIDWLVCKGMATGARLSLIG